MTQDTATTIRELRGALARIAGMTSEASSTGDRAVQAIIADINETAERALFEAEQADYEAWRAEQPAPSSTVPDDLPY